VYTDRITDGLYRILKNNQVNDVEDFAGDFTDEITKEFKLGSLYSDETPSLSVSPLESPIEKFR
jgi:hypothetical protein